MDKILKILKVFKRKNKKSDESTKSIELIGISGKIYNPNLYKVENGFIRDRVTDEIIEIHWINPNDYHKDSYKIEESKRFKTFLD